MPNRQSSSLHKAYSLQWQVMIHHKNIIIGSADVLQAKESFLWKTNIHVETGMQGNGGEGDRKEFSRQRGW